MKRLLLSLCIWLTISSLCQSATFEIWIDPNAKTYGYDHREFKRNIKLGLKQLRIQSGANLRYNFDSTRENAHVRVRTKEIYLGNGVHARGLYDPANRTIWIHNGFVSPGHSVTTCNPDTAGKCQWGNFWWASIWSSTGLSRVGAHQFLHSLGYSDSNDPNCLMNQSVGAALCPVEISSLRAKYGFHADPGEGEPQATLNGVPLPELFQP